MSEMFSIGIFGCGQGERQLIKNTIHKLSFLRDIEIATYWFDEDLPPEKLTPYLDKLQIAVIPLAGKGGEAVANHIYQENPSCLICFCGTDSEPVKLSLCARPISYHAWREAHLANFSPNMPQSVARQVDTALLETFCYMLEDSKRINKRFCLDNKRSQISMPLANVLFFQSDLKYVNLHCKNGECYRFFGKLSDVRQILAGDGLMDLFLCIHKSYLVNRRYIIAVDKNSKSVHLLTGQELPVSTAQYNHVLEQMLLK